MKKTKARKAKKKARQTIVYTYGAFDLFHSGHVELLNEARALGDRLVVGLFTDDVVSAYKREPVIPFEHRKLVLEHCRSVDEVVPQHDLAPDENLIRLKPHILAKGPGADWNESGNITGAKTAKEIDCKIVVLGYHDGISTSGIIKKIKGE